MEGLRFSSYTLRSLSFESEKSSLGSLKKALIFKGFSAQRNWF
jgi:hypothetical protein